MSNAKIISIIDHEIHAVRSDIDRAIDKAVQNALWFVRQQLTEMNLHIQKLEDDTATLKAFAQHYVITDMKNQANQSQGPLANDDWVTR